MPKKRNVIDAVGAGLIGHRLSRLPDSSPRDARNHDPFFATQSLKWLCGDAVKMRAAAEIDDIESFLTAFAQLRLRIKELEPVVSGLRYSWAAVSVGVLSMAVDDGGQRVSSVHLYFYQRCREVLFTVWAAAEYDKLKASVERGESVEFDTKAVRRRWPHVRTAVAGIEGFDLDSHDLLDAELGALIASRPDSEGEKPVWSKADGQLRFCGQVIREVTRIGKAPNLCKILDSFQELGWPSQIDDPLPPSSDLSSTVKKLNVGLGKIVFCVRTANRNRVATQKVAWSAKK